MSTYYISRLNLYPTFSGKSLTKFPWEFWLVFVLAPIIFLSFPKKYHSDLPFCNATGLLTLGCHIGHLIPRWQRFHGKVLLKPWVWIHRIGWVDGKGGFHLTWTYTAFPVGCFLLAVPKKNHGSCLEPLNLELADRFVFTKVVRETFKKEDLFVPLMTFHHNTPSFKTAV